MHCQSISRNQLRSSKNRQASCRKSWAEALEGPPLQ